VEGKPNFAHFDVHSGLVSFSWSTRDDEDEGTYTVSFRAGYNGSYVTCAFSFRVGRYNSPPSTSQVVGDQTYMITEDGENRKLTVTFEEFEDPNWFDSHTYAIYLYDGVGLIDSGFMLAHVSDLVLDIYCTDNTKAGAYEVELRVTDDNRTSASNGVQSGSLFF